MSWFDAADKKLNSMKSIKVFLEDLGESAEIMQPLLSHLNKVYENVNDEYGEIPGFYIVYVCLWDNGRICDQIDYEDIKPKLDVLTKKDFSHLLKECEKIVYITESSVQEARKN